MAATATETKERTIYTVKGTASGPKVAVTKAAGQALEKAQAIAGVLRLAPGMEKECAAVQQAIQGLIDKLGT